MALRVAAVLLPAWCLSRAAAAGEAACDASDTDDVNLLQKAVRSHSRALQMQDDKPNRTKILAMLPDSIRPWIEGLPDLEQIDMPSPNCTIEGKDLSDGNALHPEKYLERSADGACDRPEGMWKQRETADLRSWKYAAMGTVLGLHPGMHVLDWGTGCGTELSRLVADFGCTGYGIDVVKGNMEWAKEHLTHGTFCLADGHRLPFADNSLDAVISNAALYHLGAPEQQIKAMVEVTRVLRPGGCSWMDWLGRDDDIATPKDWADAEMPAGVVLVTVPEEELWGVNHIEYGGGRGTFAVLACKKTE